MTILNALKEVYKIYEKADETPDVTSEDFKVRLAYANNSISKWENLEGIEWKELFGTIEDTLVDGEFETPSDFKRPAGSLWIDGAEYNYVRPERVKMEVENDDSKQIYTITGGKIKVYPVISDDFTLDYRKKAVTYSIGNEETEIEMSDPYYLINDVVAQLYLDDDDTQLAGVFLQIATQKLEAMKLANETSPFYQEEESDNNFYGFGR